MNEVCPGCGRHCALNDLHCERGKEYVRTGVMPARNACEEGGHGSHGSHGGRRHAEQGAAYRELPLESKLAVSIRELAHAFRRQEDRTQDEQAAAFHREVFACLGEDEKNTLLTYMEKVCRSLHHRD